MDRLLLESLNVTQDDLRDLDIIKHMITYIKNGGFWTKERLEQYSYKNKFFRNSPLIAISEFEDGMRFISDGHHRVVATYLGGREYLTLDECNISFWNYKDYIEIAPENNWFTPFDPKIHVRTADFSKFKNEAKERFQKDAKEALNWLNDHFKDFRKPRTVNNVPELAKNVNLKYNLL